MIPVPVGVLNMETTRTTADQGVGMRGLGIDFDNLA
jgi:hypothetical protein